LLERIFISLPTLETERLILRKLEYSDKSDIFEYAKNPEVAKYVMWEHHQEEIDTIAFLNVIYDAYNKNEPSSWGIKLKENSKIIGTIGFVKWDKVSKIGEIGYALSQEYWGKGIITEAVKEIVKLGFNKMELQKITAHCIAENLGSKKVLLKSGFKFDGFFPKQATVKGKLVDIKWFSISAVDYNKKLISDK